MQRNAKRLQEKAKKCKVTPSQDKGKFTVESPSGTTYTVTALADASFVCVCEWSKYRNSRTQPCAHCLAVETWLQNAGGRAVSFWANTEDAARQKHHTERVGRGLLMTTRRAQHNQTA